MFAARKATLFLADQKHSKHPSGASIVCTDVSPWILRNPWHGISTDNPIRPT